MLGLHSKECICLDLLDLDSTKTIVARTALFGGSLFQCRLEKSLKGPNPCICREACNAFNNRGDFVSRKKWTTSTSSPMQGIPQSIPNGQHPNV